jgi:O-antigen/teichoic acid export membrane protein
MSKTRSVFKWIGAYFLAQLIAGIVSIPLGMGGQGLGLLSALILVAMIAYSVKAKKRRHAAAAAATLAATLAGTGVKLLADDKP